MRDRLTPKAFFDMLRLKKVLFGLLGYTRWHAAEEWGTMQRYDPPTDAWLNRPMTDEEAEELAHWQAIK